MALECHLAFSNQRASSMGDSELTASLQDKTIAYERLVFMRTSARRAQAWRPSLFWKTHRGNMLPSLSMSGVSRDYLLGCRPSTSILPFPRRFEPGTRT